MHCSLTGYLYLGCLAGAGYVYIRMRGWKLSGLLYVTRASMKEALSSIETGGEPGTLWDLCLRVCSCSPRPEPQDAWGTGCSTREACGLSQRPQCDQMPQPQSLVVLQSSLAPDLAIKAGATTARHFPTAGSAFGDVVLAHFTAHHHPRPTTWTDLQHMLCRHGAAAAVCGPEHPRPTGPGRPPALEAGGTPASDHFCSICHEAAHKEAGLRYRGAGPTPSEGVC